MFTPKTISDFGLEISDLELNRKDRKVPLHPVKWTFVVRNITGRNIFLSLLLKEK